MAEVITDKKLLTEVIEKTLQHEGTGNKIYNYYAHTARLVPDKALSLKDFEELFYPLYYKTLADDLELHNKKCFISIPITGVEEQAREQCKEIQEMFAKYFPDCEIFSPFEVAPEKNMPDSYYMSK